MFPALAVLSQYLLVMNSQCMPYIHTWLCVMEFSVSWLPKKAQQDLKLLQKFFFVVVLCAGVCIEGTVIVNYKASSTAYRKQCLSFTFVEFVNSVTSILNQFCWFAAELNKTSKSSAQTLRREGSGIFRVIASSQLGYLDKVKTF